jgi:hypothetical protein
VPVVEAMPPASWPTPSCAIAAQTGGAKGVGMGVKGAGKVVGAVVP